MFNIIAVWFQFLRNFVLLKLQSTTLVQQNTYSSAQAVKVGCLLEQSQTKVVSGCSFYALANVVRREVLCFWALRASIHASQTLLTR